VDNLLDRDAGVPLYVGVQTNLRKSAVLLPDRWCGNTGRINVPEPLVLANDLFHRGPGMSGWRIGCSPEAARLQKP